VLRAIPFTASFRYNFVIGQNVAAISAVIGTGVLTRNVYKFSSQPRIKIIPETTQKSLADLGVAAVQASTPSPHDVEDKGSCAHIHKTHRQFLEDACFGVHVDTTWHTLSEDVRRFLLLRVSGKPAVVTHAVHVWLSGKKDCSHQYGQHHHHNTGSTDATDIPDAPSLRCEKIIDSELTSDCARDVALRRRPLVQMLAQSIDDVVQWISVISGAAHDCPRELWYRLNSSRFERLILWVLLRFWKLCWWSRNFHTYAFLIAGKEPAASLVDLANHGTRRTLRGNLITVDRPREKLTGFIARSHTNLLGVMVYQGLYDEIPKRQSPIAVAFYDERNRLYRRQECICGLEKIYHYDDKSTSRWPISKTTIHAERKLETQYDAYGRPVSGQQLRNGVVFDYEYRYKHRSVGESDLVCATYKSADNTFPALLTIYWCVRPTATSDRIDRWIPSNKVQVVQAAFFSGQTYEVRWIYKHAHGADIEASVYHEGVLRPCFPPAEIMEDEFGLLEKPKQFCFDDEDLLIYHSSTSLQQMVPSNRGYVAKTFNAVVTSWPLRCMRLGEVVSYHKLSSSALRTALWDSWQKAPYIDALTASFVDELILRKEPLLREYWQLRDSGFLRRAADVLDQDLEQIVSAIEPTYESSSKCPLIIKPADLFIMGLGKDANQMTSRLDFAYSDTETATSVIFSDNGCWPDSPGGVSNCRRDLVNGHKTIKGHCLAESANDFGVPRYQIERNITSMKVLPLWGLDSKTAYHGVLDNLLQTQVDDKISQTSLEGDIKQTFIPLLHHFVRGARLKRYTRKDLVVCSNVFLKMNKYFETCDFNKTWQSNQVREAWIEAWFVEHDDPNVWNFREYPAILHPSLSDFQEALNLYIAYFFIYSVELPSPCPSVFQSTNHGIGSLYGMLLKYRRGTTWGLWDHAILWRETCLNISPAQCLLPLSVQSMLIAGIKLSCHLAYTHVDIILPCTSLFNPDWEQDLGTDQGLRGSKKVFARKIDPIVNGIGNMDLFEPVTELRSKFPTTVMLSNVQFIKDVKTAVLAADVIVNRYGFKDYRLVVYGAQDRQPSYVLETVNLINTRGLAGNVTLAGFGSPKEVFKDAWLFLNSSLSEGLPLAIGEAALSGVPIVATEVGATSLVLTDPDDMKTLYGEVVPPNDPESLARAQLSILAMMGSWTQYTRTAEPAPLPYTFSAEDVSRITQRMYEKSEDRRQLGLKLRDVVLRSFHGHRYLREHEQMFWIQRRRAEIRRSTFAGGIHPPAREVYGQNNLFKYEDRTKGSGPAKMRWQLFEHQRNSGKKQDIRTV
jgi:glycosyltransferase involved in cell wall biosynthesis